MGSGPRFAILMDNILGATYIDWMYTENVLSFPGDIVEQNDLLIISTF